MFNILRVAIFLTSLSRINGCVYTALSSLPPDKLEVNWNCKESIQNILIFDQNPEKNVYIKPILQFSVEKQSKNYYKTNISFEPEPFPGGWSRNAVGSRIQSSHCLYYVRANFYERRPINNCFKIHPAWMSENKNLFKKLSLSEMFLPGTHNSGSEMKETSGTQRFNFLDTLILTQDQNIWNQLVYGIRYLDLRIGYYPEENDPTLRFWINHDLVRVQPLLQILNCVAEFSRASPDEIIILDFHRFPAGFGYKNVSLVHMELIDLIGGELKALAIDRPLNQLDLTLEKIWESNKRIVISYNEDSFIRETPWLWESISQKWGNKRSPDDLENFMDSKLREVSNGKLWALMAELTPTALDFLNGGSLREMADSVNRLITNWFAERQNWTTRANIVASDFFLGTNLIKIAIEENIKRAKDLEFM